MSDDQDQPRRGGDAGTDRALDELRVALEQLATRMGAGFREDLAQIRAIAASVAERDITGDVEALRVDVATLVGRDSAGDLRDDVAALRAGLDRLASGDDVSSAVQSGLAPLQSTVDRIAARLDDDSGRAQVLARFESLEAKLDRLAGFDGEAVLRELAAVRGELGAGHAPLLADLQDNLADVASGEVVGALWDEVRKLRTDLPDLVAAPEPVVAASEPDPQLATLTDELAVLRTELAEGLVVEPSDALSASLDALKVQVDGLRDALGDLRPPEPAPVAPVDAGRDEQLLEQLGGIRAAIDEVHVRLDEGLVLDDAVPPVPPVPAFDDLAEPHGDIDAIADQIAALRDFVASEFDTTRQTVSTRLDVASEATAATIAELSSRPVVEPAPVAEVRSGIDGDAVEDLRSEIRAAGAVADQVVDALREELKALRRRIAVKAAERVLDDQQLAQIADAVAARLAADRADG